MIDLTPLDVRKKRGDFRRILRGYDPEEVDGFLDLVAERMEELVRQNLTLTETTDRLQVQLKALEEREKAVQDALVTAQKLKGEVHDQSQREAVGLLEHAQNQAELLRQQAEMEIERRLGEAEGLVKERQRALEELERSRQKFLKGFRSLLERELDSVEVEESRRPLEDSPVELNLRGWKPAPKMGDEGVNEEGGVEGEEVAPPPDSEDEWGSQEHSEEPADEEEADDEEKPNDGETVPGQEPLWLSSLLKEEDEGEEEEEEKADD